MNKALYLSALLGGLLSFFSEKASAQGLIGSDLVSAETSSDVFTFFNLERQGEKEIPGGSQRVAFKPSGDAFRALVTLEVTTDKKGVIRKLDLKVARSFIDDPRNGVFAADLIKTLLLNVCSAHSTDEVASLAQEIQGRAMSRSTGMIMTPGASPNLPPHPSAGYQTYADSGSGPTLLHEGKLAVSLRNENALSPPSLQVTIAGP